MVGKISTFNNDENGIWGMIETAEGAEYPYREPGIFIKIGFDVEFELMYDENGNPYAVNIHRPKIEYPELSKEALESVIVAISQILKDKGFILGTAFPILLKTCGIENLRVYAANAKGFIEKYLSDIAEMRNDVKINGSVKPSVIVSKGVESNLDFITEEKKIVLKEMDDEVRHTIINAINGYLYQKDFINGTELPDILHEVGISDFHEYAKSIFELVKTLNTNDFCAIANVDINGKKQPCIITNKQNADKFLFKTQTEDTVLDSELCERAENAINDAIKKHGFIVGSYFNHVLSTAGIKSFKDYSPSIHAFIATYFSDRFSVHTNEIINGKKYPCIITDIDFGDAKEELSGELCNKALAAIHDVLNAEPFITENNFYDILDQAGIENYQIYSSSIADFISKYFNNELNVHNNVLICGRKYHCVITYFDFDVNAYQINELVNTIKSIIDTEGFADISVLESLIRRFKLASSLSEFMKIYLEDMEIQKDRVIDHKLHSSILVNKGCSDYCCLEEYDRKLILDEEIICKIAKNIEKIISNSKKNYIHISEVEYVLQKYGVSNLKYYADSLSELINKYFSEFSVKRDVFIEGTEYPLVIIRKSEEKDFSYFCEDNHNELNKLFDAKKYVEFIRSPYFYKYRPTDIPIGWLEKALTCAQRVLTNDITAEIKLNCFQKDLITSDSAKDFIIRSKKFGRYNIDLINECYDSFLPKRKRKIDGTVFEALNNIKDLAGGTVNSDYKGLMDRTAVCWNELYPLFTFVYLILNSNKIKDCINNMCIKLQTSNKYNPIPEDRGRWLYLPQIIEALYKYGVLDTIDVSSQTILFATFFDFDALEAIAPISHFFSDVNLRFILSLLDDYKKLSENDYKEAFLNNVNRELVQKICVKLWLKENTSVHISTEYLLMLSYILKYDGASSLDEIINSSVKINNLDYTRNNKIRALICSLDIISENIYYYPSLYPLGEYSAELINTFKKIDITDTMLEYCDKWARTSADFFESKTSNLMPVTEESYCKIVVLFDVFECNFNFEMTLQKAYADWYFSKELTDEAADRIDSLIADHAYLAVCNLVESLSEKQITKKILDSYITALLQINKHDKALSVAVNQNADEGSVVNAITNICLKYGISKTTFDLITSCFSIHEAIERLMVHQTGKGNVINTALIVLLALDGKPFHIFYMYNAFGDGLSKGYSRILGQVLQWSKDCYENMNFEVLHYRNQSSTKYIVIEKAFDQLTPESVLSFVNWCGKLEIPGTGKNSKKNLAKKQSHSLSSFYDKLIYHGKNASVWLQFYEHLLKRYDINAWKLCVTVSIIEMLSDEMTENEYSKVDFSKIEGYVSWMLGSTADKDFPVNFVFILNIFFDWINSPRVIHQISEKINSEEVHKRVFENKLNPTINKAIKELKQKSLDRFIKTGEIELLEFARNFDDSFSLLQSVDYAEIIKHNDGKLFVLKELCSAFSKNEGIGNLRDIAASISGQTTNYPTARLIEAVKFLYSEHSEYDELVNLIESSDLLDRVRRSVAKILSIYPNKRNLFEFEKETFSVQFKLMVYSVVSGVVFDHDLYKTYFSITYDDAVADKLLEIHAYFQYKLYLNEVYYNADHSFLYIERRFLKALTAKIMMRLDSSTSFGDKFIETDDSEIISVMKRFEHCDKCFYDSYTPFKNELMNFLSNDKLNIEQKRQLVYVLLIDNWRSFLNYIAEGNIELSSLETTMILISKIAQRECSVGLCQFYLGNIDNDKSKCILAVSKYLSPPVYEALTILNNDNGNQLYSLFCNMVDIFENKSKKYGFNSFGSYIKFIFELDESVFVKYKDFFIPFMVSIQFKILLYDSLYDYVVSGKARDSHLEILDYLGKDNKESEASIIKLFLCSIRSAMRGDKVASKQYFNKEQFASSLPEAWKPIAENLKSYLDSDTEMVYYPVHRTGDSSAVENKSIQVSFIRELSSYFKIDRVKEITYDELKAMKQAFDHFFRDDNASNSDKIKSGLIYLTNLKDLREPTDKKIAYKVAKLILSSSLDIKPVDKLITLNDSFVLAKEVDSNRFSEWGIDVLTSILKNGIRLEYWCKYKDLITNVLNLDSSCDATIISDLKENLDNIALYLSPTYPLDEQLSKLEKTDAISLIDIVYASNLQDSIDERIQELKSKSQLKVSIVNIDDKSTDRFIYGMVENIGQHTVALGDGKDDTALVTVRYNQSSTDRSVNKEWIPIWELQSKCISGFRVPIPVGYSGNSVDVTITVKIGDEVYSQCSKTIAIEDNAETPELEDLDAWYTVKNAVGGQEELFGRDDIKNRLRNSIKSSLSVLYGPSRIGKTSLMNWIKTELSREVASQYKKRIITISIASEGSMLESDYAEHFAKKNLFWKDFDDEAISEYLLIDTITYGLKLPSRCTVSDSNMISLEFIQDVRKILNDCEFGLSDRYANLGNYLSEHGTEIWLLFDEFQQVVEKWEPGKQTQFAKTFADLQLTNSKIEGIKIVLCGSDELLRHMECKEVSNWRKIINTKGIIVGPLDDKNFARMIKEDKKFAETGLSFAPEAVDTLFNYTGGIALYGKHICNAVLSSIAKSKTPDSDYFRKRKTIYPYDISLATQMLIKTQGDEQRENTMQVYGVYYIYDAVVKNLNDYTDKLYLQYIAQWLYEHQDTDHFPKKMFSEKKLKEKYSNIEDSLLIACKRRILTEFCKNKTVYGFKFTTLFYYYAFLGINKKSCKELEELLFESDDINNYVAETELNADSIVIRPDVIITDEIKKFKSWDVDSQVLVTQSLISYLHSDALSRTQEIVAKKIQKFENFGKFVGGDDNSNNLTVNYDIKVIAESIGSLAELRKNVFDEDENKIPSVEEAKEICMKAFSSLPLPSKKLLNAESFDDYEEPAEYDDSCCDIIYDSVMKSDKINLEEWAKSSSGREFLREGCGVKINDLRQYGDTHYNCMLIGLYLFYLFKGISTLYSDLDFTPATIMLCKTIERMLQEKHLPLYKDKHIWVNTVKNNPKNDTKEEKKKTSVIKFYPKSTIGTFTTALAAMFEVPSFDDEKKQKDENRAEFINATKKSEKEWSDYYKRLKDVKNVRNDSAHTAIVTKEQCSDVVKALFSDGINDGILTKTVTYVEAVTKSTVKN